MIPTEYGIAIIAASAAILGGAVTGLATIRAAADGKRLARYKSRVRRTLEEVAAFRHLERAYSKEIASSTGRSPESIRREFRKKLRDSGVATPTDLSGQARLKGELGRLAGEP